MFGMANKVKSANRAEILRKLEFESWTNRPPADPLFTRSFKIEESQGRVKVLDNIQVRKPFYFLLKMVGGIPFTRISNGEPKLQILSLDFFYSITFYVAMMMITGHQVVQRFTKITNGRIDEIVDQFLFAIFFAKYAFMPVFLWLPIRKLTKHQRMWNGFYRKFKQVTGKHLEFDLQKYTIGIAVGVVVASMVVVTLWIISNIPDKPWLIPVYMVPLLTSTSFTCIWSSSYIMMGLNADHISTALKRNLHKRQGNSEGQVLTVKEHRTLWLELTKLLQSNNDVSTVTFTYHAVHVFVMLTLSLYALLSGLSSSWSSIHMGRVMSCITYLLEMWVLANSAHYTAVKFDAVQWDPAWVAPDRNMPSQVIKEINIFLDVAAAAPNKVDIGGFVVINRCWLTKMLGNLLSSIIILLQFKVSQTNACGQTTNNNTVTPSSLA